MPSPVRDIAVGALLGASLLLSVCVGCASTPPPSSARLARADRVFEAHEQDAAAVKITVGCKSELGATWGQIGSGVIIGPHHVLTAMHVLVCDGGETTSATVISGSVELPAKVEAVAPGADVARLEFEGTVSLRRYPRVGAPRSAGWVCLSAAHPKVERKCGRTSTVSGAIAHSAIVVPGNSGSGLYDDRGYLVGIVVRWVGCRADSWPDDKPSEPCGGISASLGARRWLTHLPEDKVAVGQ